MCDEWGRDDHLRAEPWLGFWQQIEDLADEQLLELGVQVGLGSSITIRCTGGRLPSTPAPQRLYRGRLVTPGG
jgi:hypothetical protein